MDSSSSPSREWKVPHAYAVGDRIRWRHVELVCTRAHYAGDDALHPWDPGDGWSARKAATLWTPSGPAAAAALAVVAGPDAGRDRQVFLEAAGVRQST